MNICFPNSKPQFQDNQFDIQIQDAILIDYSAIFSKKILGIDKLIHRFAA